MDLTTFSVSLSLLTLAALPQGWESGQLPTPPLNQAEVRGDTVWFFRGGYRGRPPRDTVAYGRDLATEGWVRRDRWRSGRDPRRLPASASDTVPVGDGLALVLLEDGGGDSGSTARYGVLSLAAGRLVPLEVKIPPDVKWEIFPRDRFFPRPSKEKVEKETAALPSAWVAGKGALWVGLGGGYSEGYGALGGLLRYDLETGRVEGIWREELGAATVTDLVVAAGRVWIGTLSPGEYGPYGTQGLLTYDPASGRLERFAAEDSPLPADLVWAVEAAGGRVWAATPKGVAGLDPSTGEWTVARFRPELAGDTLVFDLVEGRAPPDSARLGVFLLMEALGVERRATFLEAARSLPTGRFRTYAREPYDPTAALAHPAFVSLLMEALGRRGRGRLAAGALKRIPGPEREEAVARALEEAPPERASTMARHLARAELPQGRAWIRGHLDPARSDSATVAAAMAAAGEVRDRGSVPALLRLVEDDTAHALAAVEALIAIGPPEGWNVVGAWVRRHPEHRYTFLERSRQHSGWDVWDHESFRAVVCSVAHRALGSRSRARARVAAVVLVHMEDPAGMRALVERFMSRAYDLQYAQQTLEYVTGVESPVHPRRWSADALAQARAFWRRWLEQGGAEEYASCQRR